MKNATSIALGFFDGVHIAHQKIITAAVNYARDNALSPIALTFDKSPLEILEPGKARYITDSEEKAEIISTLGADICFLPVSSELLDMSPEEFAKEILAEKYSIRHAVCGYNYRFGKNGSGDVARLRTLGEKYGFSVEVCDRVTCNGEDVSSSHIRELLSMGDVSTAGKLLGRNFTLRGTVSEGKHLGSELGFPTANVFFKKDAAVPLCGVYKTAAVIGGNTMAAITNVGTNPTVGGEQLRSETYIPGFSEDIYGRKIEIEFIDFVRKETKFESLDMLKKQIAYDISLIQKG